MPKGNFAFFVLLASALAASTSYAAVKVAQPVAVDGCAVLMSMVGSAVKQAGRPYSYPEPRQDRAMAGVVLNCPSATAAATAAFGSALNGLGIQVSWGIRPSVTGDYCLSGKLSECYPRTDFGNGPVSAAEANFTYDAWKAVRTSVASFISSNGDATFDQRALRLSLQAASAAYIESPMFPVGRVPLQPGDTF